MLELELQLIEERRLTLPPGQLPWERDQRRREARRREQRLGSARSNLRRARWRWKSLHNRAGTFWTTCLGSVLAQFAKFLKDIWHKLNPLIQDGDQERHHQYR